MLLLGLHGEYRGVLLCNNSFILGLYVLCTFPCMCPIPMKTLLKTFVIGNHSATVDGMFVSPQHSYVETESPG